MSAIDSVVGRHDPLCNVEIDFSANETCNCGTVLAKAELTALRARIRTLEGLLGRFEWDQFDPKFDEEYCYICDRNKGAGHAPDCELKAALDGRAER